MKRIKYRSGYKYQLADSYHHQLVKIRPIAPAATEFLSLSVDGLLIVKAGYAYDGPSGPTKDTPDSMRGALVHDALYELMRRGLISEDWRDEADEEFYRILREDGMDRARAKVWYYGVRAFAAGCADPENKREVHVAP